MWNAYISQLACTTATNLQRCLCASSWPKAPSFLSHRSCGVESQQRLPDSKLWLVARRPLSFHSYLINQPRCIVACIPTRYSSFYSFLLRRQPWLAKLLFRTILRDRIIASWRISNAKWHVICCCGLILWIDWHRVLEKIWTGFTWWDYACWSRLLNI